MQSIEHTLRGLEKLATEQQGRLNRVEKELADYKSQADRPFEQEERLKQLLARQQELDSLLDLDKGEQQVIDSASEPVEEVAPAQHVEKPTDSRNALVKTAEAYMRATDTAIRELPITERAAPQSGPAIGKAVAKDERGIAVATGANGFFLVSSIDLGDDIQIGWRLSLRFSQGRVSLDKGREHGR